MSKKLNIKKEWLECDDGKIEISIAGKVYSCCADMDPENYYLSHVHNLATLSLSYKKEGNSIKLDGLNLEKRAEFLYSGRYIID